MRWAWDLGALFYGGTELSPDCRALSELSGHEDEAGVSVPWTSYVS